MTSALFWLVLAEFLIGCGKLCGRGLRFAGCGCGTRYAVLGMRYSSLRYSVCGSLLFFSASPCWTFHLYLRLLWLVNTSFQQAVFL